jgi:MFS transporter, ACS family, hexuronate transporter
VPYVASDAGSLLAGWLSGHTIALGWTMDRARKTVIVAGMLCMSAGIPAALTDNSTVALAFISLMLFGLQAWINNVQTIPGARLPDPSRA